jgi:DNA-binding transcriptional ArsR family regulator
LSGDALSLTFAALAHPARRAILARLSLGETSVQELARPLAMSAPAVTKHLKSLERGGLIRRGRSAQWRPCRIEMGPILSAESWIEGLRRETELRLDRLEAYLEKLQAESASSAPTSHKSKGQKP